MATSATAIPQCPKCSGPMWDQKAGKFPYKPLTPIFKCKDKECAGNGGVIWEPKVVAASAPKQQVSIASKPNAELPDYLRDAGAEDSAELAAKVEPEKPTMRHAYKELTAWVLSDISPMYTAADIGLSPEAAAACVATLFISAVQRGKVA